MSLNEDHLKKWSMIAINDVFDELKDENKRLLNELLFADKCLNVLIEYKSFVEMIFTKYSQHFESQDVDYYQKNLVKSAEEVLTTDNQFISMITEVKSEPNIETNEDNNNIEFEVNSDHISGQSFELQDIEYYHKELTKTTEEALTSDNQWITNGVNNEESDDNNDNNYSMNITSDVNQDSNHYLESNIEPIYQIISIENMKPKNRHKKTKSMSIIKSKQLINKTKRKLNLQTICDLCGEELTTTEMRISHMKSHLDRYKTSDDYYRCDHNDCEYRTVSQHLFVRHIKSHKQIESFECSSCGKAFASQSGLRQHIDWSHRPSEESLVCDINGCNKQFNNKLKLKRHHYYKHLKAKTFLCDYPNCGQSFRLKPDMMSHQSKNHPIDRPFNCTVDGCPMSFIAEFKLKAHVKTHSTEHNFWCPNEECLKTFKTSEGLKLHILQVHTEKTIPCEWPGCHYKTSCENSLAKHHRLAHSAVRDHCCQWDGCHKQFKTKKDLSRHMRTHLGDKRHACHWPGCDYRCVHKSNLVEHEESHSSGLNYPCDWPDCGKRLKTKRTLKVHSRSHTKVIRKSSDL